MTAGSIAGLLDECAAIRPGRPIPGSAVRVSASGEIEHELLAHPLVDEIAVLGQPDQLRGELVCAVVRRSAGLRDVTLAELCAFLDERGLMKQKWPERLVVVDEFPLTGLGKVAKAKLAQQIAGGTR